MGTASQPVLSPDELNDTDQKILSLLSDGRVTPPLIAEELDISREYASERLIRLKEHDHLTRIAPGLYELVDDPREDAATEAAEKATVPVEEYERLQERVHELEQQLDAERDHDPTRVRDSLRAAKSALSGTHPDVDTAQAEIDAALEVIGGG